MSAAAWGALTGGGAALGAVLVVARVLALRRPSLAVRVLPYLRDLPQHGGTMPRAVLPQEQRSAAAAVFGPLLSSLARGVEQVLGGSTSVRRRLRRAGSSATVQDFRVEQVVWGFVAFGVAAAIALLGVLGGGEPAGFLLLCGVAFVCGVLARDTHLTGQVRARERQVVAEFPTVAELLALAVAAGESPVGALDRVVRRSAGALSDELAAVLAEIRTGEPVSHAFDRLAAESGVPVVSRFAQGVAVAVERGTPLADVLHARAADVREAGRRELIESAARREVFMMVPVVFLVLPVTVLFAFWPGVVGLSLST